LVWGRRQEVRVVEDTGPVIYVVDDDEAVRDSLKLLLESHGMAVEDYARQRSSSGVMCLAARPV
jgi:FixJ family two-component response regulator